MQLFFLFLYYLTTVKAAIPPVSGSYKVKQDTIHVGGYSGAIQTARIWWPTPKNETEKFPLVVFMHGMTAGGTQMPVDYGPGLVTPLASFGFIVIGPESCPHVYCENFYKDGLHTVDVVMKNSSLHPIIKKNADLSKKGVFGHSMGGAATVFMANNAEFLGAVALHPSTFMGDGSTGVKDPLFYVTGSADSIVPPAGVIRSYKKDPIKPKVVAEITGANHFEPTTLGKNRITPYVNQYMLCHVKGEKSACPYIYGKDASSVCGQKKIPMSECEATE